jgi:hypothetical protein
MPNIFQIRWLPVLLLVLVLATAFFVQSYGCEMPMMMGGLGGLFTPQLEVPRLIGA